MGMDADAFQSYILSRLGVDNSSRIEIGYHWKDFPVDMVFDDSKSSTKYVLEIKPKAIMESVAILNLYRDIMILSNPEQNLRFVLVTKHIDPRMKNLADELGIEVLTVPSDINLPSKAIKPVQSAVKITSEKSWNVVSGLIALGPSSIRNLSITQGVSYGWTHATIQHLIAQGIARKFGNQVSIHDIDKLLNGVAWERPTYGLVKKEHSIPYDDAFEAAKDLTDMFDSQNIPHAFASYFAGSLYTGQSVRFDSIQMYSDMNKVEDICELVGPEPEGSKLKLQIMAPDREVFDGSRSLGGVKVTSPPQTLLDLAGLGYKGKDMTRSMVAVYGQL